MKKLLYILLLSTLELFGGTIRIAVATNLSYVIEDIKTQFYKLHPETKVQVILGSSGKLSAQIKNGAPFGIFMAANMNYPQVLYENNLALTQPRIYAQGALSYFSTKRYDFTQGMQLLKDKKNSKIAIANPKTAPYGYAALEAMKNAKVYKSVKQKLIYAESIAQTLFYVMNAADIGIVATSSLYSPKMHQYKKGVNYVAVDKKLYTPIKQGIILLKKSKNTQNYKDFYDFILSKKAKKIFERFGYFSK